MPHRRAAIVFTEVSRNYHGLRPLRVASLAVARGERVVLSGFDRAAAEVFVNLVNGTLLPDTGDVHVLGTNTRHIQSEEEWLGVLDRLGIVSMRSSLLEGMTVLQNLALPLSIEIDPVPDDIAEQAAALADEVGVERSHLHSPVAALSATDRVRLHLGRALAFGPAVLLFEHPTMSMDERDVAGFARTVADTSDRRGAAVVAITEDATFASGIGGRHLRVQPATGALVPAGGWRRWFAR